MTVDLITSPWSADDSPMADRVDEALSVVSLSFEVVQHWESEHTHRTDEASRLRATTAAQASALGPDLWALWCATLEHVGSQNFRPEELYTSASVYSERRSAGVLVSASERRLNISCELSDLRTALGADRDLYSTLLKDLGRCRSLGGCWLRHRAAFAGRPAWLYISKVPFAKLDDALRYDQVTDEVRRIRHLLNSKITTEIAVETLRALGAEPELLGADRIYVELGDPLKDGGAAMLKAFEKKVGKLIK